MENSQSSYMVAIGKGDHWAEALINLEHDVDGLTCGGYIPHGNMVEVNCDGQFVFVQPMILAVPLDGPAILSWTMEGEELATDEDS